MGKMKTSGLYLVITQDCCRARSAVEVAKAAISAGVDIIQMREKNLRQPQLISLGAELKALCADKGVLFIVNDDPYLAVKLDADGVHIGQEDACVMPVAEVRKIVGPNRIIGISTHSFDQFKQAHDLDVDYLAFGPLFVTKTKNYHIGIEDLEKVLKFSKKPVVCIGGINENNVKEVVAKGAKIIAVIRAITEAEDIITATKKLKKMLCC